MSSKIKPLMPSQREKKRYLVFEVISGQELTSIDEVSDAIIDAGLKYIGTLGMAKAGVIVLRDKWNKGSHRGMLKTSNSQVDKITAALALITMISGKKAIVKSVGVSGSIKKAEMKYLAAERSNDPSLLNEQENKYMR